MAKKQKRLYTVGPNTQFIFHRKDRCNYWPGQTFSLDHVETTIIEKMEKTGKVVDVTGKKQTDIDSLIASYKAIDPKVVEAALKEAAAGGEMEYIGDGDDQESK